MSNNLKWISESVRVERTIITKVESMFKIDFPRDYIECIIKNDGGYPKPNKFNLNGNKEVFNNLLSFDEEDSSNMIDVYNDVKDRLIESFISDEISDFNSSVYYSTPEYLKYSYLEGKLLA